MGNTVLRFTVSLKSRGRLGAVRGVNRSPVLDRLLASSLCWLRKRRIWLSASWIIGHTVSDAALGGNGGLRSRGVGNLEQNPLSQTGRVLAFDKGFYWDKASQARSSM